MVFFSLLYPQARLDLYLTTNRVKPACIVGGVLPYPPKAEDAEAYRELARDLERRGISHVHDVSVLPRELIREDGTSETVDDESHLFHVGRDEEALETLLSAETDGEVGRALGYPEDSIAEDLRDTSLPRYLNELTKMRSHGRIPSYLAYISFIPAGVDGGSRHVPEPVREIARYYQSFVREHEPMLAVDVEASFSRRRLPAIIGDEFHYAVDGPRFGPLVDEPDRFTTLFSSACADHS